MDRNELGRVMSRDLQAINDTLDFFNVKAFKADVRTLKSGVIRTIKPSEEVCKVHNINHGQLYAARKLRKFLDDATILEKFDSIPDDCTLAQIAELYDLPLEKLSN